MNINEGVAQISQGVYSSDKENAHFQGNKLIVNHISFIQRIISGGVINKE